jgi:hypothetical protein
VVREFWGGSKFYRTVRDLHASLHFVVRSSSPSKPPKVKKIVKGFVFLWIEIRRTLSAGIDTLDTWRKPKKATKPGKLNFPCPRWVAFFSQLFGHICWVSISIDVYIYNASSQYYPVVCSTALSLGSEYFRYSHGVLTSTGLDIPNRSNDKVPCRVLYRIAGRLVCEQCSRHCEPLKV